MRSAFFGLDMALRSLAAQQQAIETTNHNIANANTPGFSRQAVQFVTTTPYTVPAFNRNPNAGQMGTGVQVDMIKRIRDTFLDYQIRQETQSLGTWQSTSDVLQQIEVVFNEPSDSGLNTLMGKFWAGWQEVANNPQDLAVRSSLVEQSNNLAVTLNRDYDQLNKIKQDIDDQIRIKVSDINGLAQQLADLNAQISSVQLAGDQPNDLRDKRDLLMDQLSKMVKFSYTEGSNGAVNIFIAGTPLVERDRFVGMRVIDDAAGYAQIVWPTDGRPVELAGGELKGMIDMRDVGIDSRITQLNQIANRLITDVNNLHRTGYSLTGAGSEIFRGLSLVTSGPVNLNTAVSDLTITQAADSGTYTFSSWAAGQLTLSATVNGVAVTQTLAVSSMTASTDSPQVLDFTALGVKLTLQGTGATSTAANIIDSLTKAATNEITTDNIAFFSGTGANNIAVNTGIVSDVRRLAASSTPGAAGDGSKALAIAQLQHLTGASSVTDLYKSMISQLGVDAKGAETMVTNEDLLVQHLETRKQSVAGVSLDEETANLVKYQHAYNAAARVITTVDEMLDKIINSMGVVGR